MRKVYRKVRVDWYKVLYELKDEKLINFFWYWFNHHNVKSKLRAARFVLLRYYSTTSMPERVIKLFSINHDIKTVRFNLYEL